MRYFAQGFILIVGLSAAIAAATIERKAPKVGNCYAANAANVPMLCE
jgi:hypothetical protein